MKIVTLLGVEDYSYMVVIDAHIVSSCLIEVTIGSGKYDVTRLKHAFYLFRSGWSLESQSVVVGRGGRSQQFYYFLHNGHLSCLHVES